MTEAAAPHLTPGRVYRTREFARWGANAPRLAKRLVREGELLPLAHGLFVHPKKGRFGEVPPTDDELMRSFLDDTPFVFTGPDRWNALGLGSTSLFATTLVYNTKRSGTFDFNGRRFALRRVQFPKKPTPEWFVVDLLENAEKASVSRAELGQALERALARRAFDGEKLQEMAALYGTKSTQALVNAALKAST